MGGELFGKCLIPCEKWISGNKHLFPRPPFFFFPLIESFLSAIKAKRKSHRKINLNTRSVILVTASDDLASAGTDYGSAHFPYMRQKTDGLHIKRLQTCQWPFIKA